MLIQQGTQAAILVIFTTSTSNLFILFIGKNHSWISIVEEYFCFEVFIWYKDKSLWYSHYGLHCTSSIWVGRICHFPSRWTC